VAVVKLAVLFFGGQINHRNGPDAMMTSRNVPLRGIADSTMRESAPPGENTGCLTAKFQVSSDQL
jgi:hypothetical protein